MAGLPATRFVLMTPAGRGAIATILVRGPRALDVVAGLLHASGPAALDAGAMLADRDRPRLRRWLDRDGEEVIVCTIDETGVEIHCHGGAVAAEAIACSLVAAGCQRADWFDPDLLGEADGLRAAALQLLCRAPTERTASILLDQYSGALRKTIEAACASLQAGRLEQGAAIVDRLLQTAAVGLHLVEPFRVVLVGPPNVGKSSLANALLGYQRAIVHHQPGTTRDALTATTAIDGWPVELIDTAGLRDAGDELEQAGIERARQQAAAADLLLSIIDRSTGEGVAADELDRPAASILVVHNKSDLPPAANSSDATPDCLTSAATGQGIAELAAAIAGRLVLSPPEPGEAVLFTPAQVERVNEAQRRMQAGAVAEAADCLRSLLSASFQANTC